jgi:hypothetical protein
MWRWANTPFQSALFRPSKSRSSMGARDPSTQQWTDARTRFMIGIRVAGRVKATVHRILPTGGADRCLPEEDR